MDFATLEDLLYLVRVNHFFNQVEGIVVTTGGLEGTIALWKDGKMLKRYTAADVANIRAEVEAHFEAIWGKPRGEE